jgi:tetratricopeptide (TPR) repeat protein
LDPRNVDVLYNKGVAFGKLVDYTQAIQYYDQALAIEPNYTGALIGKGFALHQLGSNNQSYCFL